MSDEFRQQGNSKQTAQAATRILESKGYIIPTAEQRQYLVEGFARRNKVIYGKAFDAVKLNGGNRSVLVSSDAVYEHFRTIVLCEIKSTNREDVGKELERFFFALTTAELLVAQNLGDQYRFVFVNVAKRDWDPVEMRLQDIFAKARAIYPTWSIRF